MKSCLYVTKHRWTRVKRSEIGSGILLHCAANRTSAEVFYPLIFLSLLSYISSCQSKGMQHPGKKRIKKTFGDNVCFAIYWAAVPWKATEQKSCYTECYIRTHRTVIWIEETRSYNHGSQNWATTLQNSELRKRMKESTSKVEKGVKARSPCSPPSSTPTFSHF